MKKYELLQSYFLCRRTYLEQDVEQLQRNVRWRNVDTIDCLELIIAKERLAMFCEVSKDISDILKLPLDFEYRERLDD